VKFEQEEHKMEITFTQNNKMEIIGISTEEKPTENIINGSTYKEVDTKKFYIFFDGTWYEQ
jgi:hypothetical protein